MALNIKDPATHEAVKQLAAITGESQAQAVTIAVQERLARLRRDDLQARILAIGQRAANRMSPQTKRIDHATLLYDDQGLPA